MSDSPFTGKLSLDKDDFVNGIDLGVIDSFESDKAEVVESFEYPDTDAREQEWFDQAGSEKKITLTGTYIGTDWQDALWFKETMEAYINGFVYDQGINFFLAIYIPNYFGTGEHLWIEREGAPLLEMDNEGEVGLNRITARPAMQNSTNRPICVTPHSFKATIKGGTSPVVEYVMMLVQRMEF